MSETGRHHTEGSTAVLPVVRDAPKRAAWWRRLEARVVVALGLLGVLSVGASGYLLWLTVRYFDGLGDAQVSLAEEAIDESLPFYQDLVTAKREAFDARTRRLALELADAEDDTVRRIRLERELATNEDLIELRLTGPSLEPGTPLTVAAESDHGRTRVETTASAGGRELVAVYGVDPELERRFQHIGELRRDLRSVDVEGVPVARDELERAVVRLISAASAVVLLMAFVAGFFMARSTTRKVSDISEVLRRISAGQLDARAPPLGSDEIGVLASDLNATLDQLDQARRKVAYLQRIGAWQEMARRIAHEIKNPLTPIQLAVQQLREKDPGKDPAFSKLLATSVEIIEDEIDGLRRMVTSFSQFAKVPEVRLEQVKVSRIIEEFERAYGRLGEGGDEELDVGDVDPQLEAMADRQLLKQVLVNLVENATLSARESGAKPVRIKVAVQTEPGVVVVFVEDNGPGVDPERRERIFEPYETTREHGTGLGLAIVKKVVLDHGGEISVEDSAELGGARFVIRLPALSA